VLTPFHRHATYFKAEFYRIKAISTCIDKVKEPRVAIYSRVSSDKQSHESQIAEVRAYCLRQDWTDPVLYTDVINGARFTREGLEALMAQVRRGKVDVLACYKLDRLGRSLPHLAQIVEELRAHKCALVCTSQGIDTTYNNPAGQLQLGVLMAVAEFERATITERIKAGLRAKKARGEKLGPAFTFPKHIDAVCLLLDQGFSINKIAREMKLAPATVWRCVRKIKADRKAKIEAEAEAAATNPPETPAQAA
jgi:DNA invertase Pin-like site-specific DNA recombinase